MAYAVDCGNNNYYAVLGKMLSVADNDASDIADAESVNKDLSGRNIGNFFNAAFGYFKACAVFNNNNVLPVHAH